MDKQPKKTGPLTSDDTFSLKEAKASYGAMPGWQRIAIWSALALLALGIIGDLVR